MRVDIKGARMGPKEPYYSFCSSMSSASTASASPRGIPSQSFLPISRSCGSARHHMMDSMRRSITARLITSPGGTLSKMAGGPIFPHHLHVSSKTCRISLASTRRARHDGTLGGDFYCFFPLRLSPFENGALAVAIISSCAIPASRRGGLLCIEDVWTQSACAHSFWPHAARPWRRR